MYEDVEPNWRKRLGRELRARRLELGWSQKELADKASPHRATAMDKRISTDTIHRAEHGDNITTGILNALATALDVQVRVRLRTPDKNGSSTDESEPAGFAGKKIPEPITAAQPLLAHPPTLSHGKKVDPANPLDRIATAGAQITAAAEELRLTWQPIAMDSRGGSELSPRVGEARTSPRRRAPKKTPPEVTRERKSR